MDTGLGVPMQQNIREISSIVDDDVIGLENVEVTNGAEPFVGVRGQVEIEGHSGMELIEATEQALWIMGGGRSGIYGSEFPRQIDFRAIDGKEPMA
jgi:hypothetical protein